MFCTSSESKYEADHLMSSIVYWMTCKVPRAYLGSVSQTCRVCFVPERLIIALMFTSGSFWGVGEVIFESSGPLLDQRYFSAVFLQNWDAWRSLIEYRITCFTAVWSILSRDSHYKTLNLRAAQNSAKNTRELHKQGPCLLTLRVLF